MPFYVRLSSLSVCDYRLYFVTKVEIIKVGSERA